MNIQKVKSNKLVWNDEPPTKSGYYWIKRPRINNETILRIEVKDGVFIIEEYGIRNPFYTRNLDASYPDALWAGPIERPS